MKLLYVASNPAAEQSLELEREIAVLQLRLAGQRGLSNIQFLPFPHIDIDEFSTILTDLKPDILHLSAHGEESGIAFSDHARVSQFLSTADLVALLKALSARPKLVFIGACSSETIARELAELNAVVPFAVGTTAEISNPAATTVAVKFYEWLARGSSVRQACDIARPSLSVISDGKVGLTLAVADGIDAGQHRFSEPLRLLCCFPALERLREKGKATGKVQLRGSGKEFVIELGVAGCPRDTRQVTFFIDDQTLFDENGEDELAWIVREQPNEGGEVWVSDPDEHVLTTSEFRIHAAVTTSGNEAAVAVGSICEGLQRYYFEEKWHDLEESKARDAVNQAIDELRGGVASRRTLKKPQATKRARRRK